MGALMRPATKARNRGGGCSGGAAGGYGDLAAVTALFILD